MRAGLFLDLKPEISTQPDGEMQIPHALTEKHKRGLSHMSPDPRSPFPLHATRPIPSAQYCYKERLAKTTWS